MSKEKDTPVTIDKEDTEEKFYTIKNLNVNYLTTIAR